MDANKRSLGEILSPDVRLVAPLFQRPYVWSHERNWEPFWQALQEVFDRYLQSSKVRPYFLGALVLDQLHTATGSIPAREIIDGQQRLTTLLIFFEAAAKLFSDYGLDYEAKQLRRLAFNDLEEYSDQRFKVWPTNVDRDVFRSVLAGQPATGRMSQARQFFSERLAEWLNRDPTQRKERAAAVVNGVKQGLVFVVIDLGNDDDGQLIFETLNALGTPLLPSDLVKNLLFRQASAAGLDTESLYHQHWRSFEDDASYWRAESGVGRLLRPRLDTFLLHYLTLKTSGEVAIPHLFRDYRDAFLDGKLGDVVEALDDFDRHAKIYRVFDEGGQTSAQKSLRHLLTVMDHSTVLPLVLGILMGAQPDEADKMCAILESYLVRRMICGGSLNNINRLTVELINHLKSEGWSSAGLRQQLLQQQAHTLRWPDDEYVRWAVTQKAAYYNLKSSRIAYLLARVEIELHTPKTEINGHALLANQHLSVEHLMPQKWQANWPLPHDSGEDAVLRRNDLINHFGNLTILTQKLNSDVSNENWKAKRAGLNQHSVLLINSHLATLDDWDETAIARRSTKLAEAFCRIWPR